jgi:hypothetical protein
MKDNRTRPPAAPPRWVMVLYLATGLSGLVCLAGRALWRAGLLARMVHCAFVSGAGGVLENLGGLGILMAFWLVPAIPAILAVCLYIVVVHRGRPNVFAPALVLLVALAAALVLMYQAGSGAPLPRAAGAVVWALFALYFVWATVVGLGWLVRRR